jgi:hypothetical protein
MPAFHHDPALNIPPLPDLAPALAIAEHAGDPDQLGVNSAQLQRGLNRLAWALIQARETVDAAVTPEM